MSVGPAADEPVLKLDPEAVALIEAARKAQGTDWPRAAALATELRRRLPDHPAGYQVGMAVALNDGAHTASDALLAEAQSRFPGQPWVIAAAAWNAGAKGDTTTAAALAAELRQRWPATPAGYQVGLTVARHDGRIADAQALVEEATSRFAAQPWPLSEAAQVARAAGRTEEALRLAAELRDRFPNLAGGYQIAAEVFHRDGHLREAVAMLTEAAARVPGQPWLANRLHTLGRLAENRTRAAQLVERLRQGDRCDAVPAAPPRAGEPAAYPPEPHPGHVVVVLGMHRAGTSLCMKILQDLGVNLGAPLLAPNLENPEGFYEHRAVVGCHELLLAAGGIAWDTVWLVDPPPESFWHSPPVAAAKTRLKELVVAQRGAGRGLWGFKDPRTARFLPLWSQVFAELELDPIWVVAIRDPRSVAASLEKRNGIGRGVGELLWVEHHLDILRGLGPHLDAVVAYERWFSEPVGQLRALAAAVGATSEDAIAAAARSIKRDLAHHVAPSGPYAFDLSRALHERLCAQPPDLPALHAFAETAWRQLEALAAR